MKKCLVVTSASDETADYVIEKYGSCNFIRFNTDELSNFKISVYNENTIIDLGNEIINLCDMNSIYYRKPTLPSLEDFDQLQKNIAVRDFLTFLYGFLDSFNGICLTKPSILKLAENKIYQYSMAVKCGFLIPQTLFTNDDSCANKFNINSDKLVIKSLGVGQLFFNNYVYNCHTSILNEEHITDISRTPIFLQEFIKKEYEIRVTIINTYHIAVKIINDTEIDWRKASANDIRYEIYDAPEILIKKCLKLMNMLNIKFGAFDFLVVKEEYYFLEVNPNGQWLLLEEVFNFKISDNIVKYLGVK